ncbi:siderophore-interacting protein [Neisseria sp. CCUG12390]|uniref:siderophore-interacting protein n=1 Tax=Neisseria sp. CCUG12390 TaxID=3392035 RepID=UPI003A0FC6F9
MNPNRPRLVQVASWQDVSPHLRRIVFHSEELADYPYTFNGAPLKIFLPADGQTVPDFPEMTPAGPKWAEGVPRPFVRTYTVRDFDRRTNTLTIDFVLHGDNGPASAFAGHVQTGQTIGVSAPRGRDEMLKPAAEYLFVGDLTALPAIESMLLDMDDGARGHVFVLLPENETLPATFRHPRGIRVHTVYAAPEQYPYIVGKVRQARPDSNDCYVWFAGEAAMVGALRDLARKEWRLSVKQCYAVPYWRLGEAEEKYHQKRHDFMDGDSE